MMEEYILTLNAMGYMTRTCDHVQQAFLDFATQHAEDQFLDIGCAFGNTTLPLLQKGIAVSGCDLDKRHFLPIVEHAPACYRSLFTPYEGHFPSTVRFPENCFKGIVMAMVLHFLKPGEVEQAFQELHSSLAPGGKLFLTMSTPYQGMLRDFLPIYQVRRKQGLPFPGLIEALETYVPHRRKDLPNHSTVYAPDEVEGFCHQVGLQVEQSGFFTRVHMPEDFKLDGREYGYVIASKE